MKQLLRRTDVKGHSEALTGSEGASGVHHGRWEEGEAARARFDHPQRRKVNAELVILSQHKMASIRCILRSRRGQRYVKRGAQPARRMIMVGMMAAIREAYRPASSEADRSALLDE